MQEEPLAIIKLDASSRKAGALKGEAIPPTAGCRALNNAADESLRLARRVKINEIRSTIILFTD
jgi:hypothetical protein